MAKNSNLHTAKKVKNDEFYTRITDIEKELLQGNHYDLEMFNDSVVYCNCDDDAKSEFWKFFELNFDRLNLKKLVATHFDREKPTYKIEITRGVDLDGDGKYTEKDIVTTPLKCNGDFRSEECIELLKEADFVITNPPFSLFRAYIAQLMEYGKKFLIVGNKNTVKYKEVVPYVLSGDLWLGATKPKEFVRPDGSTAKFGNICWYTNIPVRKRKEKPCMFYTYEDNKHKYPKYNNYDAIEVGKVSDIPEDYYDTMGVPITYMDNHNPDVFDIVDIVGSGLVIGDKAIYSRIIIKRKA